MSIESTIHSLLNTTAGVTNVYCTVIPRDATTPFMVLTVDDFKPYYTIDGEGDYGVAEVEIEIYATTQAETITEFNKIRDNLSGINQTVVGTDTVDGFTIQNVFNSFEPELELYVKTVNIDLIIKLS